MVHTQKDLGFLGSLIPPVVITPTSFTGLRRWYDADYYTGQGKTDGNALANTDTWFDNSTFAEVATPRNTAKPVFKTSIFGSKPAVLFNTSAVMKHTLVTWTGDFTAILVSQFDSDSILLGRESQNYQLRQGFPTSTKNSFFPNGTPTVSSDTMGLGAGNKAAQAFIRTSGTMRFWENATNYNSNGGSNTNTYTTDILGLDDGGPLHNVYVGAIYFYDVALSDADYGSLYNNYIKPRFGTA